MRDSTDEDVDMLEAQDSPIAWWQSSSVSKSSPIPSPLTLGPKTSHLSVDNTTSGRIPTPIYGHFQSLDVMDTDVNVVARPSVSYSNRPVRPRALRMPTAIEEDESMESFEENEVTLQSQVSKNHTFPPPTTTMLSRRPTSFMDKLKSWAYGDGFSNERRSGGKAVLSMGFKADCQKCLNKVPGHFNHIIRE